jgi:AcrR family transcriptional regulator
MNSQSINSLQERGGLRQRIVEVAMEAFHQKGIKNVTMDDVAHAMTMSKRTLYQIFSDKEELLLACVQMGAMQHSESFHAKMMETDNVLELILFDFENKLNYLKNVSPLFFSELRRYPRVVAELEKSRKRQMSNAVSFLSKGVEQGLFLPQVDFSLFYEIVTQHIDIVKLKDLSTDYSASELFLHLAFYNLRGITTLEGARIMDEFLATRL